MSGIASHGQGVAAISTGIAQRIHGIGCDRAIPFYSGFHADSHRMARAGCDKLFLTGIFEKYRSPGGDGQMSGNIFNKYFLFAAKAAADARFDHPNTFYRQTQHRSQLPADMEGHLGAGTDDQPVVFIPVSDHHMRLNMCLLYFWDFVFGFEDLVCFCQSFFNVANINVDARSQVPAGIRIGKIDILRLVVQAG